VRFNLGFAHHWSWLLQPFLIGNNIFGTVLLLLFVCCQYVIITVHEWDVMLHASVIIIVLTPCKDDTTYKIYYTILFWHSNSIVSIFIYYYAMLIQITSLLISNILSRSWGYEGCQKSGGLVLFSFLLLFVLSFRVTLVYLCTSFCRRFTCLTVDTDSIWLCLIVWNTQLDLDLVLFHSLLEIEHTDE